MSIDSSEYATQSSNSSGNRAPPPPFSSQQRKRPALSNLGIEVSLASDIKTPNTPTPNSGNDPLDSSDAILKVRPTPTPPVEFTHTNHPNPHYYPYQQPQPDQNHGHHHIYSSRSEDVREPQLAIVLEALSDFQTFYDQKTHRIEALEIQLRQVSGQLYQKETELQATAAERIANLKTLETHKIHLRELEAQLKDFSKFESIIASKFDNLESLMAEMSSSKEKFLLKESELTKGLEEKEMQLKKAQESIKELTGIKEELEKQKAALEDENKDRCLEFNTKIYELNVEIKGMARNIESLTSEKEFLRSDLKIMTTDRDRIQKECSMALKEITELAVSDKFPGCESKDLGSLECSVAWITVKCNELNDSKLNYEMELVQLKQTVQELEKHLAAKSAEQAAQLVEIVKLKSELELKEQDLESSNKIVSEQSSELETIKEFKRKLNEIGVPDDFDKLIEKLSQRTSERKVESLQNEISQLKRQHEKELEDEREEYGKMFREENSKWNLQREKLENEIKKLKKTSTPILSNPVMTRPPAKPQDEANLTAILRDLNETSEFSTKQPGKRSSSRASSNNNSFINSSNKRRLTNNSASSQNSPKMSSPNSVNSADVWNIFK